MTRRAGTMVIYIYPVNAAVIYICPVNAAIVGSSWKVTQQVHLG